MSTPIVKVLFTEDDHWAVELNGKRVIYPCRGAAISAAVYKAIEDCSFLMIYEPRVHASAPTVLPLEVEPPNVE